MAVCQNGRETIERDDSGVWLPDPDAGPMPTDHFDHAPALMVSVEHSHDDSEQCVACAWGTNVAAYRVAGDVFVCTDHLATGVNIAIAYLSTRTD